MLMKLGEKKEDGYLIKEKYFPQIIKVERKNASVILQSNFVED